MREQKLYRIGDFAAKLGVTPDLLKYCEKKGIISSVQAENGYRYYSFNQAAMVIEYLKLQNQGFSAADIRDALCADSFEKLLTLERSRQDDIQRFINYGIALQKRNSLIEQMEDCFTDPPQWRLLSREGGRFIPHSVDKELSEDSAVIKRIEEWNKWLPVVESACRLGCLNCGAELSWGYYVNDEFAKQQEMDVSSPAVYVPGGLCLVLFVHSSSTNISERRRVWQALMERLGLRQTAPAYMHIIAKISTAGGRENFCTVEIPVEYK